MNLLHFCDVIANSNILLSKQTLFQKLYKILKFWEINGSRPNKVIL
jgi:hypothetical protein